MKLFRRKDTSRPAAPEHAVIVHIPLSGDPSDDADERLDILTLEDRLIEAIEGGRVGEFDGNAIGEDEALLYAYGPDADRLLAAMAPVLREPPLPPGSWALKRYGDVSDPDAREERVELA